MVRTLGFDCQGSRFNPWSGQKKKKKSLPGLIFDDLFIHDLTSDRSLSHLGSISGPPWKAAVGQGNA